MTRRERVFKALTFEETPTVPRDLGAMKSTGISAFAYPRLVDALGLPPRKPRVHDTGQMLALPEVDVLDALDCDVVTIDGGVTNAFDEPEKWRDYDFGGRLPARVQNPGAFKQEPDGTLVQWGSLRMPPTSYVFNADHSGQPMLEPDQPLPLLDLAQYRMHLQANRITDEQVRSTADLARRVRESTDRAVFFTDFCSAGIGIGAHSGIGVFPVICKLEPDYVHELHDITIEHAVYNVRALLPEVRNYVDIIMTTADDWGTQNSLIASAQTYRTLFRPYYRRLNDEIHRLIPGIKIFMHNCGAIYDILDDIVESGFDILNPVQWPAGGHSYSDWKERVRDRMALWGGGLDTQHTLTHGSVDDVQAEVRKVVRCLSSGGGYVFNNVHNLLAETPPEKVIAMYRAAGEDSQ